MPPHNQHSSIRGKFSRKKIITTFVMTTKTISSFEWVFGSIFFQPTFICASETALTAFSEWTEIDIKPFCKGLEKCWSLFQMDSKR